MERRMHHCSTPSTMVSPPTRDECFIPPSMLSEAHNLTTSIVGLNSVGAALIEQGRYNEALSQLTKALHLYKGLVDKDRPQLSTAGDLGKQESSFMIVDIDVFMTHHCDEEEEQQMNGTASASFRSRTIPKRANSSSSDEGNAKTAKEASSTLYRHPVRLPTWLEDSNDTNDEGNQLRPHNAVPIVILFNLALTYQLIGLEEEDDQQQHHQQQATIAPRNRRADLLERSARLYRLSYELLEADQAEEEQQNNQHNSESESGLRCILFTMALINNLGLLYRSLNHEVMANQFLERLVAILMFLVDDYRRNGGNQQSDDSSAFPTATPHHHHDAMIVDDDNDISMDSISSISGNNNVSQSTYDQHRRTATNGSGSATPIHWAASSMVSIFFQTVSHVMVQNCGAAPAA